MAVDSARVKSLFLDASDLTDSAERGAYLERECAGDNELRARVEALLRANDAAPMPEPDGTSSLHKDVAERPAVTETYASGDEQAGAVIAGKYTLVEVIGEGGMGSVWRAKQSEPVKRFVAVKLIKAGMDSKQVMARFEAERQALALMDHPSIAKVLDGGLHERRPFFVMELVKGVPITKYCDARKLAPKERLELFVSVCQAIQHAHLKGIIHRDIKPTNVLVALYDDKPVVKVIDFGVAKATGGTLTEATIDTGFGGVVGTPEYMSPEQATFNNLDIDTRTDVYALGALLYELLTGSPPFSRKELEKQGLLEILRVVREEEPPKPSTKLSTADALPTLSANRGTEPKKLTGLLKNELDWIVMKALEKDRTRRYETANGFAADVLRYLSGEAVQAHPPSAAYRLKKFVRRHRGQVIAASLLLVALLAGVVGTSWGMWEAKQYAESERLAKQDAQEKEKLAVTAAQKEREARLEEERQRKFAEGINRFVVDDFLALTSVEGQDRFGGEGKEALNKDTTLRQLLDRAADKLRARKDLDPRIEAELCWIIGVNYRSAGDAKKGIVFLERAVQLLGDLLGRDHVDTLYVMSSLAVAYQAAGNLDLALPLFEETLKLRKAKLGPEHHHTLDSMNNLAMAYQAAGKLELALPLLEETLKLRKAKFGPDHPDTLTSMNNLGSAYQDAGKLELALPLLEETLKLRKAKLGPEHPHTLTSMNTLGTAYWGAGKLELALPLLEETLKLRKAKLGPEHPATLGSMNDLAAVYQAAGKLDLALPLFEETQKLFKAKLGPEHPDTLRSMNNLATVYQDVGKLDLALPLFEETLKLRKAKLGPEHSETLMSMNNLAAAYKEAGKLDLALPLFKETLKLQKAKLGPEHPETLMSMNNLAVAYSEAGKLDLALPLDEETLKLRKAKLGPDHPDTLKSMNNLAADYWEAKQLDKSIPLFEGTLKRQAAKLGRDHPDTLMTVADLGVNYKDAGRLKEAIPLLEEAYRAAKKYPKLRAFGPALLDAYAKAGENAKLADLLRERLPEARKTLPKDSPQLAGQLASFGLYLLQAKAFTEAEPLLRESLAIREKTQPDAWTTFNTKSLLGGALLGQKKYAEAEPLLLKGYEGMKQREKTIPPQANTRLPEALDRLIQLYTETNKPDEVKKWQAERAKYPAKNAAAPEKK